MFCAFFGRGTSGAKARSFWRWNAGLKARSTYGITNWIKTHPSSSKATSEGGAPKYCGTPTDSEGPLYLLAPSHVSRSRTGRDEAPSPHCYGLGENVTPHNESRVVWGTCASKQRNKRSFASCRARPKAGADARQSLRMTVTRYITAAFFAVLYFRSSSTVL
jgi:hypothetical protein